MGPVISITPFHVYRLAPRKPLDISRRRCREPRSLWWIDLEDVALGPDAATAPPSDTEQGVAVSAQGRDRFDANGRARGLHAVVRSERAFRDVGFQPTPTQLLGELDKPADLGLALLAGAARAFSTAPSTWLARSSVTRQLRAQR
jgi:hypothetical protein